MIYKITIPGKPVPKGRPRVTRSGHTYTPKATQEAEARLRAAWGPGPKLSGPIELTITYRMPIPKSWPKWKQEIAEGKRHTKRPDVDNLTKLVMDGLNGAAYIDDSQVADQHLRKIYSHYPGTEIYIIEIKEDEKWRE